jgi:methanogenic corrinoid protein MtbC1
MTDTQADATIATLVTAFAEADFDRVPRLVKEGADQGLDVHALLDDGLVAGIREVGEMFRRGEAFLPEMMLAAEAWQAGMDVLEPFMADEPRAAARGRWSSAPSRATSTPSARTSSRRC